MARPSVSIVTGALGGMGQRCAHRLAARGDALVLCDVDPAGLDALQARLSDDGAAAVTVAVDLTEAGAAVSLAEAAATLGQFAALAHTAGLSPSMATADRILSVNLTATVRLLDALEPLVVTGTAAVCVASQAGHLVGEPTAELAAILGDPLAEDFGDRVHRADLTDPGMAYAWSKRAVQDLVVTRAPTWGAKGGRIVSLSPGVIDTAMGRLELAEQPVMAMMVELTPLGRMGRADELAAAIEFLTSADASFVTGIDLLVDGGSTNQLRSNLGSLLAGPPAD